MCGIIGHFKKNKQKSDQIDFVRETALRSLINRGPDYQRGEKFNENVWFGHTRLSIRDLSTNSHQPIVSRKFCFVFNGEIYAGPRVKGCSIEDFSSDTLYLEHCFKELNLHDLNEVKNYVNSLRGMFSIAIYSQAEQVILLMRDHLGKKPLFYWTDGNDEFGFASTVNSLCLLCDLNQTMISPNDQALSDTYRLYATENWSYGVTSVQPGEIVKISLTDLTIQTDEYFSLIDLIDTTNTQSASTLTKELEENLHSSINRRTTMSDVEYGFIVSGGLDSSLIYKMSRDKVQRAHKCFIADITGNSEFKYANQVVSNSEILHKIDYNKTMHNEWQDRARTAVELPWAHPNSAPLLVLAEKVHEEKIKVILTGEGADELFGGYSNTVRFARHGWLNGRFSFLSKLRTYVEILTQSDILTFMKSEPHKKNLSAEELKVIKFYDEAYQKYQKQKFKNAKYQAFLITQLRFYILPLLVRADRIFMQYGIESRSPFLDVDLVKFAINLPWEHKVDKKILRELASKYLPKNIIHRGKNGFSLNGMQH